MPVQDDGMTLPVFVPSLSRAGLLPGFVAQFPEGHPIYVVVSDEEYLDYRSALSDSVEVLRCPDQGDISLVRRWIGEWAHQNFCRKFLVSDDDVGMLVRRGDDDWRLRATEPEDVGQMLSSIDDLLDSYAHVGISAREGNNRAGVGPAPLLAENTRTYRVLAYQTDRFMSVEHGRVRVMEDFDVNLQLLEQGYSNCCLYYWAQGQKMTNAPGGCSNWRTHELHEESARRLAELHPGLVSLRQKQNKTDREGFGTRTEVTIQWKRAHRG
jgi:hypothetical protein